MRSFFVIKICELLIIVLIGVMFFLLFKLGFNWKSLFVLIDIIALVVLLFVSKKYLYHFNYFQIQEEINSEHNIDFNPDYKIKNYKNVPEPYKLKRVFYTIIIVLCLNMIALCFLVAFVCLFVSFLNVTIVEFLTNILSLFNITPNPFSIVPIIVYLFTVPAVFLIPLSCYTYIMSKQLKYYNLYYTVLTMDEDRIIRQL